MSSHCEFSDLPTDQCEHCKTGIGTTHVAHGEETRMGVGPIFETQFGGKCDDCGAWIPEGRDGRMRNGKLVHAEEDDCG